MRVSNLTGPTWGLVHLVTRLRLGGYCLSCKVNIAQGQESERERARWHAEAGKLVPSLT